MAVRSCMRTCVDDSVRVVAFCQILAAAAALVFGVKMIVEDGILKTGAWKDLSQTWFVLAVTLYGLALLKCGTLGLFGSSTCNGFCLDFHALVAILLVCAELMVLGLYASDRSALEKLATKDPFGHLQCVMTWVEANQVGFIAIAATLLSLQCVGFILAWSVRICCRAETKSGAGDLMESDYEYAPLSPGTYGSPSVASIKQQYKQTFNSNGDVAHKQPLLGKDKGQSSSFKGPSAPTAAFV